MLVYYSGYYQNYAASQTASDPYSQTTGNHIQIEIKSLEIHLRKQSSIMLNEIN